ncbi:MAG TPA: RNA polymerase sigma factor [Gemmatimonadaceae bacterium]|jgi:RNA polymerase sigma-70 factor (ECF subfamily)|nr:RNA polymerase sigma factor [Gemmatimonadaceae bacterium]
MGEDPSRRGEADDQVLIARWLGGDERAATVLVERHAPALARYVASLGEHESVEEVVQDTFVRAFGSFESFRGESSLRTWLFTIARRLVLDRRRAARRRRDVLSVEEADAVTEYTALDTMIADEAQQRVQEAVSQLTPTQREVFLLRVNEGLSYRDIARIVGTTEGAARVHFHNALRSVKERLYV